MEKVANRGKNRFTSTGPVLQIPQRMFTLGKVPEGAGGDRALAVSLSSAQWANGQAWW